MKRLIFDIETVGQKFSKLDREQKKYLTRFAKDEKELLSAKQSTALYPVTGFVFAIGLFSPDYPDFGKVYYLSPLDKTAQTDQKKKVVYEPFADEAQLLEKFWQAVANFEQVVTFNGRAFDVPFLMIRSAVNKVKVTTALMGNRYAARHVDLADQLSFFGASRKLSLDMYCKAFGIKSPKAQGITGLDVSRLYYKKKYLDIAQYCWGDVVATYQLYQYWHDFMMVE
ncbi:ribonuclease H-like domain-containing protein [Candidatus Daviesbacteria bacterium]|nr:ribonuclease H-like domain-containing protein [Candidatus Daviesbacteria bacterium]